MPVAALNPADELLGLETQDGWRITERLKNSNATGGVFSTGYAVEYQDGRRGFLKALDYSGAFSSADPARKLQELTATFNFERDVLELCRDKGCSRVVIAISSGKIDIPKAMPPFVQYLIFELADGDVRNQAIERFRSDIPWFMRALHHISVGLNQLHTQRIAHQDLKPSNVLVFRKTSSKIADLGRAYSPDHPAPHDGAWLAGDRAYAPPELLYRSPLASKDSCSRACDMYHLGSMLYFFVTGTALTPDVVLRLPTVQRPAMVVGGEAGFLQVLPSLQAAFGDAIANFKENLSIQKRGELPDEWLDQVVRVLTELAAPDPLHRGHPLNRGRPGSSQYSLERYVSIFDRLAARAEFTYKR